jgi:hypothetical protein
MKKKIQFSGKVLYLVILTLLFSGKVFGQSIANQKAKLPIVNLSSETTYNFDVLPSVNEVDSMGFNKPWAVLPRGFLQVPVADR